jgi:DNA-binding NarL/FixJ family response regulator
MLVEGLKNEMVAIANINLKVLLFDTDFYALQAVNSYLAWDRRTRVTFMAESVEQMWAHIDRSSQVELPDVIVMDVIEYTGQPDTFRILLERLRERIPDVTFICLAQSVDPRLVETAAKAGAGAFLLKQEVRLQIAWAIVYALEHDFVVTQGVARNTNHLFDGRIFRAAILPEQREYPELTDRIRQAIKLCVVEGMPAHLAADEMGISLHTIRGYIKEGYRILEAYDETEYPVDMTPQERAFMRFTALAPEDEDE